MHELTWDAALARMPLRKISEREINADVLRGLDNNSARYLDLVGRHVPAFLQSFSRLFAGAPGTLMYRELQRGRLSYRGCTPSPKTEAAKAAAFPDTGEPRA